MSICLKHLCRLEEVGIRGWDALSERYYPLSGIEPLEPRYVYENWEQKLDEILAAYLELPFEVGPALEYNNLIDTLAAKKETRITRIDKRYSAKKLFEICKSTFPENVYHQYFAKETPSTFYHVDTWTAAWPERYALLEVIAEITPEEMFGPHIETDDDRMLSKILALKKPGCLYRKNQLAKMLDIEPFQLDIYADRYHIEPFWIQNAKPNQGNRETAMRINFTEDEIARFYDAAPGYGNPPIAVFVRMLAIKALDELKTGDRTD